MPLGNSSRVLNRGKRGASIARAGFVATFVLLFASCSPAKQSSLAPVQSDAAIEAILDERVATGRWPAIVAGIIDGDRRAIVASGWADDAKTKRADGNTVFEIGSVSKVFTGTIFADMIRRGEVSPNDSIAKYLPSNVKVPAFGGTPITLASLATQHSGLPRLPTNLDPSNPDNPYADYSVAKMYAFLSGYQLTRTPGESYEYSNLGVGLLGHTLALRAGKSYEELLVERVLAPLQMSDTRITPTPSMEGRFASGRSEGGAPAGRWDIPTLAGAGGIRSTTNDMLKFLAANLGDGPAAIVADMKDAQATRYEASNNEPEIGYAWHIVHRHGQRIVWHNGQTGAYHAMIALASASHRGVVVLASGATTIDDLAMHLLDPTAPLKTPKAISGRKEVAVDPSHYAGLVGTYQLAPAFTLTVVQNGSKLTVQATGQQPLEIYPMSEDEYFLKLVDAQLTFTRDASGKATQVVLHQNGRDQPGPRVR